MRKESVRYITIGGLSSAIAVIMVFAASIMPTIKLMIMFSSGFCVLPLLSKRRPWYGLACHIASGALMLLVIPNAVYGLAYLTMFGLYPFVRYFFARFIPNKRTQLILLCVATLFVIVSAYFVATKVLSITIQLPQWAIIAVIPGTMLVVYVEETVCNWFSTMLMRLKL